VRTHSKKPYMGKSNKCKITKLSPGTEFGDSVHLDVACRQRRSAPHGSWMLQVGGDTSRALRRWGHPGKGDGAFLGGRKRGQNFCGPPNVTVAILAQGTHWAVAVTQALFVAGSTLARSTFPLDLPLSEPLLCTTLLVRLHHNLKGCFWPRPCLRASECPHLSGALAQARRRPPNKSHLRGFECNKQ